jgi:Family of unknown function (DUF6152)
MHDSAARRTLTRHAPAIAGLCLIAMAVWAHHGSSISYDASNLWSTWVTITQFNYLNPHPTMTFDRVVADGEVEHWVAEVLSNPSAMARAGWTRRRTVDALAPGTRVRLTLGTSRAGGFSAIVMHIEDEDGEAIGGGRFARPNSVDLDGVPGGLQPTGDQPLPGQEAN